MRPSGTANMATSRVIRKLACVRAEKPRNGLWLREPAQMAYDMHIYDDEDREERKLAAHSHSATYAKF